MYTTIIHSISCYRDRSLKRITFLNMLLGSLHWLQAPQGLLHSSRPKRFSERGPLAGTGCNLLRHAYKRPCHTPCRGGPVWYSESCFLAGAGLSRMYLAGTTDGANLYQMYLGTVCWAPPCTTTISERPRPHAHAHTTVCTSCPGRGCKVLNVLTDETVQMCAMAEILLKL